MELYKIVVHVFAKTMTYFIVKKLGLMKKPSVMTTYSVSVSAEVVGRAGGGRGEIQAVQLHGGPTHHVEHKLANVSVVGGSCHPGVDGAGVVHSSPATHGTGSSRLY